MMDDDISHDLNGPLTFLMPSRIYSEDVLDEAFKNDAEAHELLALIDSEFRNDPMSVQCFDSRIVERVNICVSKRADFQRKVLG